MVLSGTMSHVTVSDAEKLHALRLGARILIKGKIYLNSRDVASLLKNSNDIAVYVISYKLQRFVK